MGFDDLIGILAASLAAVVIIGIVWYVLQVVAYWKIFKKAGEAGWKSIIPVYNLYIQYKISWSGTWFVVFLACTVVGSILSTFSGAVYVIGLILAAIGAIVGLYSSYKLSKAFGHGGGFTIGLIFLSPIFILILGFGNSEYQGAQN